MNWKTPVTMVVLLLVLVVSTVVGWNYATQEVPSLSEAARSEEPKERCRTYNSGQTLEATAVTVNVFNTADEPNLARTTMAMFATQGFVGGVAENSDQDVPGGRVLLTADKPKSAPVLLVRKQLKGKVRRTQASDGPGTAGEVNVYLGSRFRGLRENAPTKVKVKGRTRVCFEVDE